MLKVISLNPQILRIQGLDLPIGKEPVYLPDSAIVHLKNYDGLKVTKVKSLRVKKLKAPSTTEIDYSAYSINELRSIAARFGLKNVLTSKKKLLKFISEKKC